ncbi:MAG: protein kinase domain-containing protein [Candidatus Zhuqueibacterota bacterium]
MKIGQTISHYNIVKKLGEGGMGVVYKAFDTNLEREVALKVLCPEAIGDPAAKERFIREARAASALNHPNIATIYEIDESHDQDFICMEYVEGETIKTKIQSGRLSMDEVLNIAMQIAEALHEAHEHEIIHRDIKSENIMVTSRGQVKVMDFGLAKFRGSGGVTKIGTTMGTVAYMSPEQVRGEEVDFQSDIWSLGVVLYEMITGKLPFGGEFDPAVLFSIVQDTPKPMAAFTDDVPAFVQWIVDKALEKDRERRYRSVADFIDDLKGKKKGSAFSRKNFSFKNFIVKKIRTAAWIAISMLMVALFYFIIIKQNAGKTEHSQHTQITFSGEASYPAISPDGNFIAYIVGSQGDQKLMVQELAGGRPLEIFSGLNFLTLKWSPNGAELITTVTFKDSNGGTFFVPRRGGASRRVRIGALLSPSPDGSHIAAISLYGKEIMLFNTTTSAFEENTIPLNGTYEWLLDLDWSPSGNRILIQIAKKQGQSSICTIRTDGSQQQQVVEDSVVLYSPRWSGGGDAIYYMRSNGPTRDFMKVPISTATGEAKAQPNILQSGLQAGDYFSLSRNNKRVLYSRELSYSNLWLVHRDGTGAAKTKQLTTGTSWIHWPAISPDGKWLAFSIGDHTRANIFVMPIEGGSSRQLTFSEYYNASPAWDSSGKEIAYGSTEDGKPRVCKIRINGGTPRIFEKTDLSPDGLSVTWASDGHILYQLPGNRNFQILNPQTTEERALVANDSVGWMFNPCFSPDGKSVAVMWNRREPGKPARGPTSAGGIWLISLEDSALTFLLKGDFYPIGWSPDGKGIYAWNPNKKPMEILIVPVNGGKPEAIITLPFENFIMNGISVTPDGNKIVCAVFEKRSDVWLMENFDPDVGNERR